MLARLRSRLHVHGRHHGPNSGSLPCHIKIIDLIRYLEEEGRERNTQESIMLKTLASASTEPQIQQPNHHLFFVQG